MPKTIAPNKAGFEWLTDTYDYILNAPKETQIDIDMSSIEWIDLVMFELFMNPIEDRIRIAFDKNGKNLPLVQWMSAVIENPPLVQDVQEMICLVGCSDNIRPYLMEGLYYAGAHAIMLRGVYRAGKTGEDAASRANEQLVKVTSEKGRNLMRCKSFFSHTSTTKFLIRALEIGKSIEMSKPLPQSHSRAKLFGFGNDFNEQFEDEEKEEVEHMFLNYIDANFKGKFLDPVDSSDTLLRKFRQNVGEIFSNAFHHSETNMIFTCGEFHPEQEKLIFMIFDYGVGVYERVKKHFGKNKHLEPDEAIKWAIVERNTTRPLALERPGGLGLGQITKFIDYVGGTIQMVSDRGYWHRENKTDTFSVLKNKFPGTVVCLEFHTTGGNLSSKLNKRAV